MLSLTMIVRNEEATLGRVLDQASRICDEMIVVDTGSTDNTRRIASGFGARVFEFAWIDDFAAARNYALDQAQGDWVLWLDADDVIPDITIQGIRHMMHRLENAPQVHALMIPYWYSFDHAGRPNLILNVVRLFRNAPNLRWKYPVHEHVPVTDPVIVEDIWIEHRPQEGSAPQKSERNLRIMRRAYEAGDRSAHVLSIYATQLERVGDLARAAKLYGELLTSPCTDTVRYDALTGLLRVAAISGDHAAALKHASNAMELIPQRPEAYLLLAEHCMQLGIYTDAVLLLDTVLKLPQDPRALSSIPTNHTLVPYTLLAECYTQMGEFPRAIEFRERTIPLHPEPELVQKEILRLRRLLS